MKSNRRMLTSAFAILAAVLLMAASSDPQQQRIASVDMARIFAEYHETKAAEAKLKERATQYQKEFATKEADLKKVGEDIRRLQEDVENPALADDKRLEKRKAFEQKVVDFKLMRNRFEEDFRTRKQELNEHQFGVTTNITEKIIKVIQEKAKRDGISLVIDKSARSASVVPVPSFIFVQDSFDISADISKILNANAPPGAISSPPATLGTEKPKDSKK